MLAICFREHKTKQTTLAFIVLGFLASFTLVFLRKKEEPLLANKQKFCYRIINELKPQETPRDQNIKRRKTKFQLMTYSPHTDPYMYMIDIIVIRDSLRYLLRVLNPELQHPIMIFRSPLYSVKTWNLPNQSTIPETNNSTSLHEIAMLRGMRPMSSPHCHGIIQRWKHGLTRTTENTILSRRILITLVSQFWIQPLGRWFGRIPRRDCPLDRELHQYINPAFRYRILRASGWCGWSATPGIWRHVSGRSTCWLWTSLSTSRRWFGALLSRSARVRTH
jgi:hypothetical protein